MNLLELPNAGRYAVIYVDPPWKFLTRSAKGVGAKSPDAHYPTMTFAELLELPVGQIAAKDCALVMWSTWPHLLKALELVEAWGFTYSTGGAWAKQSRSGRAWQFGTGYRFRSASEPLILATRGSPTWRASAERNLWVAPVREHSRKPEETREAVERMTDGPRLEIFARQRRPGWDVAGNDVDKFPPIRRRRAVAAGS